MNAQAPSEIAAPAASLHKPYAIPVGDPLPAVPGDDIYRLLEILVAVVALVSSLPLMLVVALLVHLDSRGPVLFVQDRLARSRVVPGRELIGRDDLQAPSGRFEPDTLYYVPTTFRFVKFRTMYVDARERHPELYDFAYMKQHHGGMYRLYNDPRVTRIGRRLRELTLDELPNFWNVLMGDMRLVGPRPEVPYVLGGYDAEQMMKFAIKPGITGLAQTNGRARLALQEVVRYDLQYIRERHSIFYDFKILLRTVWLVLARRGAF